MEEQARQAETSKWIKEYEALLSAVRNEPWARLRLHVEYLDEYILRWLGLCRLEKLTPNTLVENSLFLVVEAASAVAGRDVDRLEEPECSPIARTWKDFQGSLATLRTNPQRVKIDAENSYVKFKTFADTLQACRFE